LHDDLLRQVSAAELGSPGNVGSEVGSEMIQGSPALNATFPNGQQGTFIMDTGSAGMVVNNTPFSPPPGATPA